MTSAVLYGTTSDNELRPVQVTDSGEFVTDGGGVRDWYENLYVGGSEGAPSISLLSNGSITARGNLQIKGDPDEGTAQGVKAYISGYIQCCNTLDSYPLWQGFQFGTETPTSYITAAGNIAAVGDVYANKFIPADGYDVSKIGQALSTLHDVIESVEDLEGLKNLFHLLLDNLKSDPIPPTPPIPPIGT